MGRILERKKKIAKILGAGTLGLGLTLGGAGVAISVSEHFKEVATEQARIAEQQAKAQEKARAQAQIEAQARAEAQAKAQAARKNTINKLTELDATTLKAQGYTVHRQLSEMGSNCADEGRTNNTGYNGETTALAYTVSKDGRNGMVCVSHGAAGPLVSMFAVTAPPQQRPATSSQQQDKETVIKTLTGNDIKVMRQKGFELEGYSANDSSTLGSRCNNNGTTNGTGYNGWNTTISYKVHDRSGKQGKVCIEHNKPGQQGAPSRAQFSESLRPGH
ncbi:MAG: hypothetical protein LRY36_00045 [Alphaproteobacteria bacterium]|nr:hypothetical protein [Alphaproteobacteria bacterium]